MRKAALACALFVAAIGPGLAGSAPPQVTLFARPLIIRADAQVSLSGQIASAAANEYVAVQGEECGVPGSFFRSIGGTVTAEGGGWATRQVLRTTTSLRAVWKGKPSAAVTVRQRAGVSLFARSGNRFEVSAYGITELDGKRVVIERFERATRTWRTVQTVVIESKQWGEYAVKKGVRVAVPKGTLLRAHLPLSEAKPCYLAGFSKLVRT